MMLTGLRIILSLIVFINVSYSSDSERIHSLGDEVSFAENPFAQLTGFHMMLCALTPETIQWADDNKYCVFTDQQYLSYAEYAASAVSGVSDESGREFLGLLKVNNPFYEDNDELPQTCVIRILSNMTYKINDEDAECTGVDVMLRFTGVLKEGYFNEKLVCPFATGELRLSIKPIDGYVSFENPWDLLGIAG